jgi:hypothetical protein
MSSLGPIGDIFVGDYPDTAPAYDGKSGPEGLPVRLETARTTHHED